MPSRPLRSDARRNRERLLWAAAKAFADDGLSVSLDEIARRAGVGAGTVHRHFPTKQALFAAVVVARVEEVVERARMLVDADDPGTDGDALTELLRQMLAEGAASNALKAALAGTDFDLRTAAPELSQHLQDAVATLLVRAQRSGDVRQDVDVDDVMALLAGAFATQQHVGAKPDSARSSRLVAVLIDGLHATARSAEGTQQSNP